MCTLSTNGIGGIAFCSNHSNRKLVLCFSIVLTFLLVGYSCPPAFELTASLIGKSNILAARGAPGETPSKVFIEESGILRSGDNFQVHFRVDQNAFVYIFIHDSQGETKQLFPHHEIEQSNRAIADKDYVVPSRDRWFWLDENTGTEIIYVLALGKILEESDLITNALKASGIKGVKEATGFDLLGTEVIRFFHTDNKPFETVRNFAAEAKATEPSKTLQSKDGQELFNGSGEAIEALSVIKENPIEEDTVRALDSVERGKLLEASRGVKGSLVYKKAARGVPVVVSGRGQESYGSGAILDTKGHVITNWHVIKDVSETIVILKPATGVEIREDLIFAAKVVKVDRLSDLALLRIKDPPKKLLVLKAGSIKEVEVGQDVHAIGHPEGEVWTYTKGIISQIRPNYEWIYHDGSSHKAKVIQTQTPINPGSSGSPLLNERSEIIGIISFVKGGEGLNYAVAIDVIQDFLRRKGSSISKKEPSWGDLPAQHYREVDRDKDGVVDLVLVDMDGDKKPDIWIFDDNQDTQTDYVGLDSDGNQKVDVIARDLDKDGIPETYEFDPDEDGIPDLYGVDLDGDGEIDRYYRG